MFVISTASAIKNIKTSPPEKMLLRSLRAGLRNSIMMWNYAAVSDQPQFLINRPGEEKS